jgi:hypothetical protein
MKIRDRVKELRRVKASELIPHPRNWCRHPQAQADALRGVLAEIGYADALLVRETPEGLMLIDGHLRAETTPDMEVPVLVLDVTEDEADKMLVTLDPLAAMATAAEDVLAALLESVVTESDALHAMLDDLARGAGIGSRAGNGGQEARPTLVDRFLVPPFSVLDARQGYWQERKRAWLALGIQSELGRGDGITWGTSDAMRDPALNYYRKQNAAPGGSLRDAASLGSDGKTQRGDGRGRSLGRSNGQDLMRNENPNLRLGKRLTWVAGNRPDSELDETSRKNLAASRKGQAHTAATAELMEMAGGFSASHQSGTSIFDPVLCELAYRWFCPPDGAILDPFAGGSVRGIVAALLGRHYTGVELSAGQLAANEKQAAVLTPDNRPTWIEGDAKDVAALAPGEYDLLFSCPPYGNLEVYSDDPRDLSTMAHEDFLIAYRQIIGASVALLRQDRFACFVVGDFRDRKGFYRNFVSQTIAAFEDAGARLYNEAILVQELGSLPIRVGKQFESGRKLGKTHQNVLVFVKGNPKAATKACGQVEVSLPEDVGPCE